MSTIRFGVMGCSSFAKRAMIPAMRTVSQSRLVAIASRSAAKAEEYADTFHCYPSFSYQELLSRSDIDAVYIPLPLKLHDEWVSKSLLAGKHVLCEKSLTDDPGVAQRLVGLAKDRYLLLMENFLFPHHNQFSWIQNIIKNAELGVIQSIRSTFTFPHLDQKNFRYDRELGGGALNDAGTYPIKLAQLLLGSQLEVLSSYIKFSKDLDIDVYGAFTLKNENDQIFQAQYGFGLYYQCSCEILGDKGKLTIPRIFTPPPDFTPLLTLESHDKIEQIRLPPDNHYEKMIQYFIDHIDAKESHNLIFDELIHQAELIKSIRTEGQKND